MGTTVAVNRGSWLVVAALLLPAVVSAQVFFFNPESAVFDASANRYLISNVGSGDIVAIDTEGNQTYFSRQLTRTLGMVIVGNSLFVTNASGVTGFDLSTHQQTVTIPIPGSDVLNDITADPSGNLYITDSGNGNIYRLQLDDHSTETIVTGIYWPNGILFDTLRNRILFCSFGTNAPIRAIDPSDYSVTTLVTTGLTDLDGLTEDSDGNIYVSSWGSGSVYRYDPDFSSAPELFSSGHQGPADIFFHKLAHVLVVPNFNSNTVDFVPVVGDQFTSLSEGEIVNDGGGSWGVSWIDHDNDELLDVFVANFDSRFFLYRNLGDGTFAKVTDGILVRDPLGWGGGCTWGDHDNDGDADVFVANWEAENNLFYDNAGNGNFTKVTDDEIVNDPGWSIGPSWADYDSDGDLDLYVANHDSDPPTGGGNNYLYRNDGTGFVKVTNSAIVADVGHSNHASWADYDSDGDPDLLVINAWSDHRSNRLFRNDGGGNFVSVSAGQVTADDSDSWGCSWADYDNDGDLDLIVTSSQGNFLYENDGAGNLDLVVGQDLSPPAGSSFGSAWGDYDSDGDLDLFLANDSFPGPARDSLYENDGSGRFTSVTEGEMVSEPSSSSGAAWGDYDRDGDLDLFVTKYGNNSLYRNNGSLNSWINIRLIGSSSNRSAIGARVVASAVLGGETVSQMREVSGQTGKSGQNSLHVHFGLGDAQRIESLRIRWPSGLEERLRDIAVNQFITITEGDGTPPQPAPRSPRGRFTAPNP